MKAEPPAPLSGLRVLDLSRVVSGPFAARMLSDLGADVVKVEPPEGDVTRNWGEVRHGLSGFYTQQNAGKRDICVDVRRPGGADLLRRLAAVADVVIENFRPGVAERLGVGWADLHALNPRLVMLSISGFPADGPLAERPAYAPVIHAESGLLARQAAFDDRPPSDPMLSIADTNAGLHGLVGLLTALLQRQSTGLGQHVRIAMIDAMVATDDYAHHSLDRFPVRRLGGEVWDAPGGPVMIAGEFRHIWRQLNRTFGLSDGLGPDAALEQKIKVRRRVVAEWISGCGTRVAVLDGLEAAELAWADVPTAESAVDGPARTAWVEIDDRAGGKRRVVMAPYRMSGATVAVPRGAPHRGEHNEEVLDEWLGARQEVPDLVARGVLLSDQGLAATEAGGSP
ncbi:MAG TPA: CoA transferase [Acidimicrobiales bacterium]|nr:CoA transferase [Acidimicrobiales bacterium]